MKLFTTDSFWYQWRIYRDLIYILKNKDRLDSRLLKEEKPSGLEQYKEKELTYFYRLFRYSLTEGTPYHTVATLLDIFRCQRLMHYIYPGFSQVKPEQYVSILGKYTSISTEELCHTLVECWCGKRSKHDLINTTVSELKRRLVSKRWIETRAQQLVKHFEKKKEPDKPEDITITALFKVSQKENSDLLPGNSETEREIDDPGNRNESPQNIPQSIEEYLQGPQNNASAQDDAPTKEEPGMEEQGENTQTKTDVDDASDEIDETKRILAAYFRVMQRMRNAYRKDRGRYRDVYARVYFEESKPQQEIKVSTEDRQIANILRRIVLRTKLREEWNMTGTALDIKRYVNLLASDNASPEVFKVPSLKQGGKIVFLADASGSMTSYYSLESRVYSIIKEAFKGCLDLDLFCFDSPAYGKVNIKRKFYEGRYTPIVFAANYIVNWMLAFSSQYNYQVLILFSDMEENVSKYRSFEEGLKSLLSKVQKSRIKVVGAVPVGEYDNSHSLTFRKFFPCVPISKEGVEELTQNLIKLFRAIKIA